MHYFCGESVDDEATQEIYARMREKLYKLVSRLVRAYAEAKPYLEDERDADEIRTYDEKVRFYALRRYPGSFAETLVKLMKSHKLSNKKLADLSLVGAKTIQRLRNDAEYQTSKQTVLALCVGMSLSPPEAKDLFDKSDFKLNTQKYDDYIYMCVLMSCAGNSIYAVNEMLVAHGVEPLGSDFAA